MASDGSIKIDTKIDSNNVKKELKALQDELKGMENAMKLANLKAMMPFKKQMLETQKTMFSLAQTMGSYSGTNQKFMGEVDAIGKAYKKASDAMINADKSIATSMIQTAGQMMNMTTQASKISDNYERMGNPMYKVNAAGLAIADTMNKIANNGNAAVLSLKMLGPNASMKQLYDMQTMINQGLMRFQMVAIGAAITGAVVYSSLHKAAMEAHKGYAESFNTMVANLKKALEPMVEVFADVMTKVWNFVSAIAEMVISFNEAHPTLAKIIQGIMMLIPALTLLLSPLAIGIGLFGGMLAAWNSIWMLIGPLVTGLAAMSATVWIVAAAIVGLVAVITYLWNTNEGFRNAVITAWEAIKNAIMVAIDFLKPYLVAAYDAVVAYVQEKLAQIKKFWDENGQQILQAVQTVWGFISGYIKEHSDTITKVLEVAWNVILFVVQYVWDAIKNVINGAINVIMGIVKVFTGLFTGDWSKMWEGIKQILSGAVDLILGIMSLSFVGGLRTLLTNLAKNGLTILKTMWDDIVVVFKTFGQSAMNTAKGLVDNVIAFFMNLWLKSKEIFDMLRAFGATTWTALKQAVVTAAKAIFDGVKAHFTNQWNAVKEAMGLVKTAVLTAWDDILSFLKGISLFDIGKNIIKGLLDGISSMVDSLMKKVRDIVDDIKDAFTDALDINSPSKVFHQYGVYTGQGYEGGLEESTKGIISAAQRMATAAITPIASASSSINNYSNVIKNGDVYNVTIPAKDIQEFTSVVDFFQQIPQVRRAF